MTVPKKVLLEKNRVLVDWSDGHRSIFANKHLREECPCAECAGEGLPLGGRTFIPLRSVPPEDIRVTEFSMVGLYAIAFAWSDGHSAGIYPYDYLLEVCECEKCQEKKVAERTDD
ncbi:MAG: DUF971 domain-containing protein [Nitrososphaerota archaeon]|nr:DUF971 domain-containing protein [Nitrososphaerota archaeon]